MPTKLEKLLALLSDNVWHNIPDIAKNLEIPQEKTNQIVTFLAQADMIQHNPATNQIKINQNWKTLIINQKENPQEQTQTQTQQETTAIGTIIIPPQKTLIIQCTRITNLTDTSLELEIRINKKLNEIAINKIH
ncbi:MAG: hypothetical protein KIH09_15910 [Candidatus Freyarchaeota archaeon]|nr:hypothetical protein [Candidatus Jordarchaeia archaeon]